MPRRIAQLNEQLKEELANLIIREININNGLITVCFVDTTADLKYAKVGVSVLPEKYGPSVMRKLVDLSGYFARVLKNKLKIRQIPHLNWILDTTESQAAEVEKIITQIKQEES
jgi:ribosome-binding factor A